MPLNLSSLPRSLAVCPTCRCRTLVEAEYLEHACINPGYCDWCGYSDPGACDTPEILDVIDKCWELQIAPYPALHQDGQLLGDPCDDLYVGDVIFTRVVDSFCTKEFLPAKAPSDWGFDLYVVCGYEGDTDTGMITLAIPNLPDLRARLSVSSYRQQLLSKALRNFGNQFVGWKLGAWHVRNP